jgi:hypothetical protein
MPAVSVEAPPGAAAASELRTFTSSGDLPGATVDPTQPAAAVEALAGRMCCVDCGAPLETVVSHRHRHGPQASELCFECDSDDDDEGSLPLGRADGTGAERWGQALRPGTEGSIPPPDGHSRWVCISDTHGKHRTMPALPSGDVLVHAGDFTMTGRLDEVEDFVEWCEKPRPRFLPFHLVIRGCFVQV